MAGDGTSTARTPARVTPSSVSSSAKQRSIMSFFQKSSPGTGANSSPTPREKVSPDPNPSCLQETKANFLPKAKPARKLSTPVPSSDMLEPPSSQENIDSVSKATVKAAESSPTVAVESNAKPRPAMAVNGSSPTRKVSHGFLTLPLSVAKPLTFNSQGRKVVSYAESSEDDEPVSSRGTQNRRRNRVRQVVNDEDDYDEDASVDLDEDEG